MPRDGAERSTTRPIHPRREEVSATLHHRRGRSPPEWPRRPHRDNRWRVVAEPPRPPSATDPGPPARSRRPGPPGLNPPGPRAGRSPPPPRGRAWRSRARRTARWAGRPPSRVRPRPHSACRTGVLGVRPERPSPPPAQPRTASPAGRSAAFARTIRPSSCRNAPTCSSRFTAVVRRCRDSPVRSPSSAPVTGPSATASSTARSASGLGRRATRNRCRRRSS